MKPTKLNLSTRKMFLLGVAAIMVFAFHSCAQKVAFQQSSVVPAAEGYVTVKSDKNENYKIEMEISNLADVERLQPPKNSYVVWLESGQGSPKNVGRVITTGRNKVSFETVATLKPTRLFITAEENENVQYPGSMVVLSTERLN
ncbi:MAG: hypothetical protein ACFCUM_20090 [Bacteroidales bacterium]